MNEIRYETDLYEPIKKLFEKNGYEVYAEVKNCDITARKDEELIIIEMKKNFNITLVYQAMERRTICQNVYVAIPRPKSFKDKKVRYMQKLLKELRIGLITVSVESGIKMAEIIIEPEYEGKITNNRKRQRLKKEIEERSIDGNIGGSTGKKIMTAFRERNIKLACVLERVDKMRTCMLKQICNDEKVSILLSRNYYKWFIKIERGIYSLSDTGREYLKKEADNEIVIYYRKEAEKYDV